MYRCNHCNITIHEDHIEGHIVKVGPKLYCSQCGEPVDYIPEEPKANALGGAQATLISNSDNRITTYNYYGGGTSDEQVETPYGPFRKSEARFCKDCRQWVPLIYFNAEQNICDNCFEQEGEKTCEVGKSFFELGLYEDALNEFFKYEPVCKSLTTLPDLHYHIGRCFFEMGKWKEAAKYFIKSKDRIIDSIYYLGLCFFNGNGVPQDKVKAMVYINDAAQQGYKLAQDFIRIEEEKELQENLRLEGEERKREEEKRRKKEEPEFVKFYEPFSGYGFMNKHNSRPVIPCKWKDVRNFSEGLAGVEGDNYRWGFIDMSGDLVISCQWKRIWKDFHNGLACVENINGKAGFIDKTGTVVIPFRWTLAWNFKEGLARVQGENGKYGFIDKTGAIVIPCKWKDAFDFDNGEAKVKSEDGKWSFIDKTGKIVHT